MKGLSRRFWFTSVLVLSLVISLGIMGCEQTNDDDSSPTGPGGNEAPNVILNISPSTISLGSEIQFDIVQTTDDSDEPASMDFRWDYDGNGTWEEDWTQGLGYITHIPVAAGAFTVKVEGRDSDGAIGTATGVYTVVDDFQNEPPEASATVSPQTGTTATVFHFDATGTTDDHDSGEALTYSWDFEGDGTWERENNFDDEIDWTYSTAGTYFPKFRVKDQQGETDVVSLAVVVKEAPDLQFANPTVSDYTLEVNDPFTLTVDVINDGPGDTEIGSMVEVYWSHDNALDTMTDYFLGTLEVEALDSGEQVTLSGDYYNPTASDPEYDNEYIFLVADADSVLSESDEGNNRVTITVQSLAPYGAPQDVYHDDGTYEVHGTPTIYHDYAVVFLMPPGEYIIDEFKISCTSHYTGYTDVRRYDVIAGNTLGSANYIYGAHWLYEGWNSVPVDLEYENTSEVAFGIRCINTNVPSFSADASGSEGRSWYTTTAFDYGSWQWSTANYAFRLVIRTHNGNGTYSEPFEIEPVQSAPDHAGKRFVDDPSVTRN